MKKKLYIVLFVIIGAVSINAQIKELKIYSNYKQPLSNRFNINKNSGFGGGAELVYGFSEYLSAGLSFGYESYSIEQDSALEQWDWKFWETRYKGIVKSDLAADKNLSVVLNPKQSMDVMPLVLTVQGDIPLSTSFRIKPAIGGGVAIFTRKLYLEENWQKNFKLTDTTSTSFAYAFRNYAQDKTGNPFLLKGNLLVEYALYDFLNLSLGGEYVQIIETVDKYGYNEFPFKNSYSIQFGLTFIY